jgi:hypothetical protein
MTGKDRDGCMDCGEGKKKRWRKEKSKWQQQM